MSKTECLKTLVVEDNPMDYELLLAELKRAGLAPRALRVEKEEAFLNALNQESWDLIISDYSLPQFNGLKALNIVKTKGLDLPFIVVTGTLTEERAVTAMKAGAHDYIIKGNTARLIPAIRRELQEYSERQARRMAEENLLASEAKFHVLWQSGLMGIVVSDIGGHIYEANEAFLSIIGYTRDEMDAGNIDWRVLTPPDHTTRTMNAIEELRNHGICRPFEKQYITKSGERVDVMIAFAWLDPKQSDVIFSYILDITERKKKEEAERSSLRKRQFLLDMSHELRAPMHNIVTACNMGIEGMLGPMSTKQEEMMELIRENAHHELRILNDILDIAKIEAGKNILSIKNVDLPQLIQESLYLVRPLFERKGQTLSVEIPEELPANIPGDAQRLKQALVNLLNNAHKYTPPRKTVCLQVRIVDNEELQIAVIDEGPGINQDDLDFIMQPFERAGRNKSQATPGTGLGLPITKRLIELHQGQLRIHSRPGQGSEFVICLQLACPLVSIPG